jgi:hypothetical protein
LYSGPPIGAVVHIVEQLLDPLNDSNDLLGEYIAMLLPLNPDLYLVSGIAQLVFA